MLRCDIKKMFDGSKMDLQTRLQHQVQQVQQVGTNPDMLSFDSFADHSGANHVAAQSFQRQLKPSATTPSLHADSSRLAPSHVVDETRKSSVSCIKFLSLVAIIVVCVCLISYKDVILRGYQKEEVLDYEEFRDDASKVYEYDIVVDVNVDPLFQKFQE